MIPSLSVEMDKVLPDAKAKAGERHKKKAKIDYMLPLETSLVKRFSYAIAKMG